MLMPKKSQKLILTKLFKEGVLVSKKDWNPRHLHQDLQVPIIHVMQLMKSMKSRKFITETFCWHHFYWYLTNEGIVYLREYLHLPDIIVPDTLGKKKEREGEGGGGGYGSSYGGGGRGYRGGRDQGGEGQGGYQGGYERKQFSSGAGRGRRDNRGGEEQPKEEQTTTSEWD